MARAWVVDLWVKDALIETASGERVRVSPTSAELKTLAKLPDHFKSSKFGRGKRWSVNWYENVNGSEKLRSRAYDRKVDAEAFCTSIEEDIRVGRYLKPEDSDRMMRDVAKLWLKSKRRIRDSTYLGYEKTLNNYVLPRWGNTRIGAIRREHIENWIAELQEGTAVFEFSEGSKKKPRPLGPSALKNVIRNVFGAILNFAVEQNWIASSPAKHVELPAMPGTPVLETLTHEEVELMALTAQEISGEYRDYVAVHLLTYSAPRLNEMFALKVLHLDLDGYRARIEQTWTGSRTGGRKLGPPKNGDPRTVPIVDHVAPMLKALTKGMPSTAYVFQQNESVDALWDRNWHSRVWVPAAKKSKLDKRFAKFHPHVLRHTGITFAIAAGADPKIVQEMAGHRSIEETMRTYGKLFPDRLEEVRLLMSEHRAKSMKPRLRIVDGP